MKKTKQKRDPAQIANDISENIPVTKAEAIQAYWWMVQQHDKQVTRISVMRLALFDVLAKDAGACLKGCEMRIDP